MRIEDCAFGSMIIDGKIYTSDLLIYPDGSIFTPWRRRSGHRLALDDIKELIEAGPEVIIAGTGMSGLMTPDRDLLKRLSRKGILFVSEKNRKAAQVFNQRLHGGNVAACFHLTC